MENHTAIRRTSLALAVALAWSAPAIGVEGHRGRLAVEREDDDRSDTVPDGSTFVSPSEWSFGLGGGIAHVINRSAGDTEVAQLTVRWSRVFAGGMGEHWYDGSWQYGVELAPAFLVFQGETVYGIGVAPMVRRLFNPHGRWVPSLMTGLGILGTTEDIPDGETQLNFTPQIGLGVYRFFGPDRALHFEYRFHHISNNGRGRRNPSINSSVFMVTYSLFR